VPDPLADNRNADSVPSAFPSPAPMPQLFRLIRTRADAPTRFGIIERHPVMRAGIIGILEKVIGTGLEIIEAGSVDQFLDGTGHGPSLAGVLCDYAALWPKFSTSLPQLVEAVSPAPVLILSEHEDIYAVRTAYAFRAAAFLTKSKLAQQLAPALALAQSGEYFAPARLLIHPDRQSDDRAQRQVVTPSTEPPTKLPVGAKEIGILRSQLGLTRRQFEIAYHVAQGQPNQVIGKELGIAESTVKVHLKKIFTQLNVNNRTEVAIRVQHSLAASDERM
jgi:two-component system, NarL family, nitrate/nitrite response regulator NarL